LKCRFEAVLDLDVSIAIIISVKVYFSVAMKFDFGLTAATPTATIAS
jgi:hypothetical protein